MATCNPIAAKFMIDTKCHLPTDDDEVIMEYQPQYQDFVGHIHYLADSTRPDLDFAASALGSALHKPTQRHIAIMKQVLRYLQGTWDLGLKYGDGHQTQPQLGKLSVIYHGSAVKAYYNADFGKDEAHSKYTPGFVVTLDGTPI